MFYQFQGKVSIENYAIKRIIQLMRRMITDCHVNTGARHECTIFPKCVFHQLQRFNFPTKEWIADKGCGRGPTYHYLREQKIRAYIPLHDDNLGEGKLSRNLFMIEKTIVIVALKDIIYILIKR